MPHRQAISVRANFLRQQGQRLVCVVATADVGVPFILDWMGTWSGMRFCVGGNFIRPAQGTDIEMLWSEPWLALASSAEGTRIPPPRPTLPAGAAFQLVPVEAALTADWLTFVGSGLSVAAARARVQEPGSLIALLDTVEGSATCLLRPADARVWRLESFVARPRGRRLGELLLRSVMWHLWFLPGGGGATLTFQWELAGLPSLVGAWWRGWLGAAVTVERGWRWRRTAEQEKCGFCPVTDAWVPPVGGIAGGGRPIVVRDPSADWTVVVADSGLCDGWGYVLAYKGSGSNVEWSRVAAMGGWRELWYRCPSAPLGGAWTWTGEWVVIGRVGVGQPVQTRWLTAEVV